MITILRLKSSSTIIKRRAQPSTPINMIIEWDIAGRPGLSWAIPIYRLNKNNGTKLPEITWEENPILENAEKRPTALLKASFSQSSQNWPSQLHLKRHNHQIKTTSRRAARSIRNPSPNIAPTHHRANPNLAAKRKNSTRNRANEQHLLNRNHTN